MLFYLHLGELSELAALGIALQNLKTSNMVTKIFIFFLFVDFVFYSFYLYHSTAEKIELHQCRSNRFNIVGEADEVLRPLCTFLTF